MRIPAPRISARAVGALLGAGAAGAVAPPPHLCAQDGCSHGHG